jgi:hypothetical protein
MPVASRYTDCAIPAHTDEKFWTHEPGRSEMEECADFTKHHSKQIKEITIIEDRGKNYILRLFNFEDGGDMFLRNVDSFSTDYTALYPRRQNST